MARSKNKAKNAEPVKEVVTKAQPAKVEEKSLKTLIGSTVKSNGRKIVVTSERVVHMPDGSTKLEVGCSTGETFLDYA